MDQDNLLKALLNKLDGILTGGDETAAASSDNYIAWCRPGIPFQPEDLQFAVKGINGKDADETVDLIRNAAEFARCVNAIPSSNIIGGNFEQNGRLIWNVYADVLRFSKVSASGLTDEEKEYVKKFRGMLVVTKKKKDIFGKETGEEITEDSPMVQQYNEAMAEYVAAVMEYNNKRLSALNADDKRSVQDFAQNAGNYRLMVKNAMNKWVSKGYKEEVEQMNAYIRQVSQRDMTLLKAELQDTFERGKMTDPTSGGDFYFTGLYPGSFIQSDKGWTKFTFASSNTDTYSKETHASTSWSGGFDWGLWSAKTEGQTTKDTSLGTMDSSGFEMEFKLAQVPLGRPWFSPEFLTNCAWDWDDASKAPLSDGKNPPKGQLIAYPTTAVFVKDVKIKSAAAHALNESVEKSLKTSASVGWGPFRVAANHQDSSKEVKCHYDAQSGTLSIEGMQLIAFKCFALPKAPDPKVSKLV